MRTDVTTPAKLSFAPQPSGAPVALYQSTKPACDYDEIATVRVRSNTMSQTDDQLAQRLRAEARALGGDAVVGVISARVDERDRRNDDGTISDDHSHELGGTVVRFKGHGAGCSTTGAE